MRRDLINTEIKQLRELLPLPPSTRQRLSQLQLMALVCVYVRKSNYFQQVFKQQEQPLQMTPNLGFSKALNGFIMMMTQGGKLLFISDNAAEYLGHSMEDLLIHGDSVFDILDKQDHAAVQAELVRAAQGGPEDDRLFLCRMNVSRNARRQMRFGDQKVVLVHGHFLSYLPLCSRNEPVFLAHCSPVAMPETRESVVQGATNVFTTLHTLDMKILSIDKNGEFYLGYSKASLTGVSWYHLLHPDNLKDAQTKHRLITSSEQERSCILLLRLQAAGGAWRWVHCVLQLKDAQDTGVSPSSLNESSSEPKKSASDSPIEGSNSKPELARPSPSQVPCTPVPSEGSPPPPADSKSSSGSQQQSVIVATNQVLGEREAAVLKANTWLYHYYSMQSKLQYNMNYDTQRVQAYYPQMMQYQTDASASYMTPYVLNGNQSAGYAPSAHSHYSLSSSSPYFQHYHHHYPLRLPHSFDYSRSQHEYTNLNHDPQSNSFAYWQSSSSGEQASPVQHHHHSPHFDSASLAGAHSRANRSKPNSGRPSSRRNSPVNGMSTNAQESGGGGVALAAPVAVRPSFPAHNKGVFQQITEELEQSWKASPPTQVVPEQPVEYPYITPPYSKGPSPVTKVGELESPSPEFGDQRVPSVGAMEAAWLTELQTRSSWIPSEDHINQLRFFHQPL